MIGFTKDEQTLYNVGNPEWVNTTESQVLDGRRARREGQGQGDRRRLQGSSSPTTRPTIS